MILPTMTPEEKVKQMEKVKPLLHEAAMGWMNRNYKTVFMDHGDGSTDHFSQSLHHSRRWQVPVPCHI